MAKLGAVDFDDDIFDALRDDRLVIFAGAGVSMGAPSNLPSFAQLAEAIAQGTGQTAKKDPLDKFLGQLHHQKIPVHERAAKSLDLPDSTPNALHQDLLRIFRTPARVRLVTTNFDRHFETAAASLFAQPLDVYRAPALPRGQAFSGIVHVHGSLLRADEMVLTDADFGRAYLTEGWARRFLVEVFKRFTVLFVGYSHTDVVMNYLARALPVDSLAGRYALTDQDGSWELLGIKPIRFQVRAGSDPYFELYDGLKRLADRALRGTLDWQSRLAELARRPPPADEESIGEIEHALRELHTTRFLLTEARHPDWPTWLDARSHLNALFGDDELNDRDQHLSSWLATNYAIEHPNTLLDLLRKHSLRLNASLWWSIVREIGLTTTKTLESRSLKRWVTVLLATLPSRIDHHPLLWLAGRCASQDAPDLALQIFLRMATHRLDLKERLAWSEDDEQRAGSLDMACTIQANQWTLNELWTKHLRPQLTSVAPTLLSGVVYRLEAIHLDLKTWEKATLEWDPTSYGRSAIEPHEQDRYPEAVDVLVEASRDALEHLANAAPDLLSSWIARLVASEAALLRRLAIHAVGVDPTLNADDRLQWVLKHVGLHNLAEHHEVYRLVAMNYGQATDAARSLVVQAVCSDQRQASGERSAEERTARSHFNWLAWLLRAKSDCPIALAALESITKAHPEWELSEHPDLTHWVGSANWIGSQSPWSVEQILSKSPIEQIEDLLAFKGSSGPFDGPDREGLLSALRESSQKNPRWGIELAQLLQARSDWASDIWPALFQGWQASDAGKTEWQEIVDFLDTQELLKSHPHTAASLLFSVVKDGGKVFALEVLDRANVAALKLWGTLTPSEQGADTSDWLSRAINRPAGVLVEFWINGLSLLVHPKAPPDRALPTNYREWFEMVVLDRSVNGGLGRSVLASQTAFLFGLDRPWTVERIIPLFSDPNEERFAQAWDGFLVWGRLYPDLVDVLLGAFLSAVPRFALRQSDDRRRFIEFYAALAAFHVTDPTTELLPVLLKSGTYDDRLTFAAQFGYLLKQRAAEAVERICEVWLLRYWQERLQSVPVALDEIEHRAMLDWLPNLGRSYPNAVALAIRGPVVHLEHSFFLHILKDSSLVTTFPAETAKLLIYLCTGDVGYHAEQVGTIASQLPPLAPDIERALDEGLARVGTSRRRS